MNRKGNEHLNLTNTTSESSANKQHTQSSMIYS